MIYIIVKKIIFSGNYNIKTDYYIGGHSLGGFMVSHYILKYPKGIKKVLLLSAAGITDYHIKGYTQRSWIFIWMYDGIFRILLGM